MDKTPRRPAMAAFVERVRDISPPKKTGDPWKDAVKLAVCNRNSAKRLLENARRQKLQTLISFLPRTVLSDLLELPNDAALQMQPSCRRLENAVVVLFDLCSFTKLAEGLRTGEILLSESSSTKPRHKYSKSLRVLNSDSDASGNGLTQIISSTQISAALIRIPQNERDQAVYGAEQLKDLLKIFFQELMGTLTDYGGDVMRLAGDALIAIFYCPNAASNDELAKSKLIQRAAMVSMLALRKLDGRNVMGRDLHLHVALGIGPVNMYVLGDRKVGWQYVAAGEPFKSLDTALDDGTAGEMVVSSSMWDEMRKVSVQTYIDTLAHWRMQYSSTNVAELEDLVRAEELTSGNCRLSLNFSADQLTSILDMDAKYEKTLGNNYAGAPAAISEAILSKADTLERVIRLFMLPPILYACEAEASGWFAEANRVVVIFINVKLERPPDLTTMQRVFGALQAAMTIFHGIIKEFSQDDKGIVMVGAFGLPPLIGSNPAARACLAALRVVSNLSKMGAQAYIGISMGQVFTASIGSSRREYGMFGDVVNTAARLMGAGKKDPSLLPALSVVSTMQKRSGQTPKSVFSTTNSSTRKLWDSTSNDFIRRCAIIVEKEVYKTQIEFYSGGKIRVKGKQNDIEVFLPVRSRNQMSIKERNDDSTPFIGHTNLKARLTNRIGQLQQGMGGGLVVLQGTPGIGKTRLISICAPEWRKQRVAVVGTKKFSAPSDSRDDLFLQRGTSDKELLTNGFRVWKPVIRDLILLLKPKVLAASGCSQFLTTSLSYYASRDFMNPNKKDGEFKVKKMFGSKKFAEFSKLLSLDSKKKDNSDDESIITVRSQPPAKSFDEIVSDEAKIALLEKDASEKPAQRMVRRRHSIADASSILQRKMSKVAGKLQTQIKIVRAIGRREDSSKTISSSTRFSLPEPLGVNPSNTDSLLEDLDRDPELPWWAGAFQRFDDNPTLVDSRRTRGEYLLHFCKEFMPDNYIKATQVLCDFLAAETPPLPHGLPTPKTADVISSHPDKEEFDVLMGVITIASLADGGLPLLVVFDVEHPVDQQSCDLLKASLKYLNDRILILITSLPIPWKGEDHSYRDLRQLSLGSNRRTLIKDESIRADDGYDDERDSEISTESETDEFFDEEDELFSEEEGFSYDESESEDDIIDSDYDTRSPKPDEFRNGRIKALRLPSKTSNRTRFEFITSELKRSFSYSHPIMSPRGNDIFSFNPKTSWLTNMISAMRDLALCQTMHIGALGYWQCSDFVGSFFGGVELTPRSALAFYLRTQGNPFYLTEFCKFSVDNELGYVINSNHDPVVSGSDDMEQDTSEASAANGGFLHSGIDDLSYDNDEGLWWTFDPRKDAYRMLQDNIPPLVQEQVLDFCTCLSPQQFFMLKILSVIGVYNISVELMEYIYPITINPECPLAVDILALETYKIIWIKIEKGKLFVTFRDLVLHQIVYSQLSNQDRRKLHSKLAARYEEWYKNEILKLPCGIRRKDVLPQLIHHFNLAENEMAPIYAGIYGVRRLEQWALSSFQKIINACLPYVPLHVRRFVCKSSRDILKLSKATEGIVRTIAAIRSASAVERLTQSLIKKVDEMRMKVAENKPPIQAPRSTTKGAAD